MALATDRLRFATAPLAALPLLWVAMQPSAPVAQSKPKVAYAEVRAIFKASCLGCHGDTALGGLRLDSIAGIHKGGVSGNGLIVGDPEKSILIRRVKGLDGKPMMPMGFPELTKAQLTTLEDWIRQGATTEGADAGKPHWSYSKPVRPPLPKLANGGWARNPIDLFVRQRMEREGLKPSPEADRATLIRRVSLDLIGLPPTVEEVDAFLADRRPDAYERVVDRLLASPHYGERQARVWLDLARYADSNGFEKDRNRVMWPYRDWVIRAYNANMPYDQFTVEQLAGDLLPKATQDQLIATGFHRNTMQNEEGGVDPDESMYATILDRVGTTGTVFLGSTVACAQCHDHKYDPFTQKDFFSMYAYFGNNDYEVIGNRQTVEHVYEEPTLELPTAGQRLRVENAMANRKAADAALAAARDRHLSGLDAWKARAKESVGGLTAELVSASSEGAEAKIENGRVRIVGPNPARTVTQVSGKSPTGLATGLIIDLPGEFGPGRAPNGNFVITDAALEIDGKAVVLTRAVADFEQSGFPAAAILDSRNDTGWGTDPRTREDRRLVLEFAKPVSLKGETFRLTLGQRSVHDTHTLGGFAVKFATEASPASRVFPAVAQRLLTKPSRTEAEENQLRSLYLDSVPEIMRLKDAAAAAARELRDARNGITTTLVMRERKSKGPLTAKVHHRGEFLSPGEAVPAGTPHFLPPLPNGAPNSRLGLAQWIVSRDNPLTARVEMNRMWEQAFGQGIVKTSNDFGTQMSPPSHPELLDWLAVEFMDRKWDLKAMHRLIVTSATYRQSSRSTPALQELDPENRFLARGPRFRMEAEMIRDAGLQASGLLSRKIGGPSVFPYQPDGVWNNPYSGEAWMTSQGEDRYRRGLYTFVKRTAPYPMFTAFDAGSREVCVVSRSRTNTPLQALALLNDPGYLEAARALGQRMAARSGDEETRIVYGFRAVTSRFPKPAETARLVRLLSDLRVQYRRNPDSAAKMGGPDEAAWTMLASAMLNLDEAITKG